MARESVDALYLPNPQSNPQNLNKMSVTSEIRGFDLVNKVNQKLPTAAWGGYLNSLFYEKGVGWCVTRM